MEETVRETIARHDLIAPGDRVLVSLSGGPDSVALLHFLRGLGEELDLTVAALYVNHNLRPEAAAQEETFCREFCDRLQVGLQVVFRDIPALAGARRAGIEETARTERYKVLEQAAAESGFARIALGHHADDQAETVLFRVVRGTGPSGLRGMPIRRGRIIRPLLEVSRADILAYLEEHGLPYCTDQSNEQNHFRRNYIRNELLPALRERLNPKVDAALCQLAETVAEEDDYLEAVTRQAVSRVVSRTIGGKIELDLHRFLPYDRWIRRRLLRHCVTLGLPGQPAPDKVVIERLDALARGDHRAVDMPGGMRAVRTKRSLVLVPAPVEPFSIELRRGRRAKLEPLHLEFVMRLSAKVPDGPAGRRRANKVVMDAAKVAPPVVVRSVKAGDRFQPLGLGGTKKVSEYLINRKVPMVLRDEVPVVSDRQGIIWLVGFEISDRVKIDKGTRKVLHVECFERKRDETEAV